MTKSQLISLLEILHNKKTSERISTVKSLLINFQISENNIETESNKVLEIFNFGIGNLNPNQLNNLKEFVLNKASEVEIINKLNYYQINPKYHSSILDFFESYSTTTKSVDVNNIDLEFEGVQVATRDDFNMIINNGYTGDWVLSPENVNPKRVQIASMNKDGAYPRGWYINADIIEMQPFQYETKSKIGEISFETRYRLFIDNHQLIYSGNPNVKFKQNPVAYIKRKKLK